jgi:hypothetical protein
MWRTGSVLVLFWLCTSSLAGCLSQDGNEGKFELIVDASAMNGTIIESYSEGEQVSWSNVTIDFDFSKTFATDGLVTFGVDLMDGSMPVTSDASTGSTVSIEFFEHGIYDITAYAIDASSQQLNTSFAIQIELRIDWTGSNTNEPQTLMFNPNPANGSVHPLLVVINSTIENPTLFDEFGVGGQSVEFSWNIADEYNDVCQSKRSQVNDGESVTWDTIHFNTYLAHELRINYEDGQDYISVQQSVSILYSADSF